MPDSHLQRTRRITAGSRPETSPGPGAQVPTPGFKRVVGMVRSLDETKGVIRWQRIRYKNRPPVVGVFDAFGPVEDGYPLEAKTLDDYPTGQATGPPDADTDIIEAVWRSGSWILYVNSGSGAGVRQFQVLGSILGDVIRCRPFDGLVWEDEVVEIAKPYLLRTYPFHDRERAGVAYSYSGISADVRTATHTSTQVTEVQLVIPSYVSGDVLYASRNVVGGTGVANPVDGSPIIWLDDNRDGRFWAKQSR